MLENFDPETNGESKDIVADNIEQLKLLFPEVIADGKLVIDALQALLGEYIEVNGERYNFTWHGKSNAKRIAQTPSTGTLLPCKEESINWDTTQNLFIEGDNLEVLKLLQKSYHKKIKMIYIDPPYNTGKEFIYPDNYQDNLDTYLEYTGQKDSEGRKFGTKAETSGRYHTNWLNMMYPRLRLARNLLQDDGALFISIDENEMTNLKAVCDEIFGSENFIECIVWNKRIPKNDKGIGNIHEYILLYVKDASIKPEFTMRKDGLDEIYELLERLKKKAVELPVAEKEIKKLYKKNGYDRGITLYNSLDEKYRLWGKINMSWPNANTFGPTYEVLHPKTNQPVKIPDRGWRWKEDTFNDAAGRVNGQYSEVKELHDGSYMCGKIWFASDEKTQPSSVTYLDEVNTFLLRSILSTKSDGGVEVEKLFEGKSFFSYPKPTSLIKTLFSSMSSKNGDIYLDFFAGSATTGDAVMRLNAEDDIERKFIMVQLPEKVAGDSEAKKAGYSNLSELAQKRLELSIDKIQEENPSYVGDLGFKVFKLASSNIKQWDADFEQLEDDLYRSVNNIKEERSSDDVLFELLLKYGIDLTIPVENHMIGGKTIYSIGLGALLVCLDDDITLDVVEGIGKLKDELQPETVHVVLKDAGLKDDVVKTNAIQLLKRYDINDVKTL